MTPESLSQMLSAFLEGARAGVVVEDGAIAFDLAESKYSISGEYNKCLLHLWSSERNSVRRVLDAELKSTTLRLQVQRMGQTRPTRLDFCRDRDLRSPAARRTARVAYVPRVRRALERNFPGWTVVRLTTSVDLQRSFGPAYLRGLLRQGQRALAVLGVNDQETQSTVDRALTCGILWLEACRLSQQDRHVVEGLAMILPKSTATLTRQRMAHLHPTRRNGICMNSINGKTPLPRWISAIAAIWPHGWCKLLTRGWRRPASQRRSRASGKFCRSRKLLSSRQR